MSASAAPPKRPGGGGGALRSSKNIHVAGLPPGMRDEQLQRLFSDCGEIVVAKVMMDVKTSQSKGFGFVLFKSEESGANAIALMNGRTMTIQGVEVTLKCSLSQHDGQTALSESNTLYVRNVPDRVSSHELKEYFAQFGTVQDLQVKTDYKQPNFSLVAVVFGDVDTARKALQNTHNRFVFSSAESGGIPVLAKYADSNETKTRRRETAGGAAGAAAGGSGGPSGGTPTSANAPGVGGSPIYPRGGARQMTTPPPFDYQGPQVIVGGAARAPGGVPPAYESGVPAYDMAARVGRSNSMSSFGSFPDEDYYGAQGGYHHHPRDSGTSTPRSRASTPYRHDPYSADGYVLEDPLKAQQRSASNQM